MPRKYAKGKESCVSEYYNAISSSYNELHGGEQLAKLGVIKEVISPGEDDLVLDVGCGTCLSSGFFGCKFKGVEPSKEMVLKHPAGLSLLGRDVFIGGAEDLLGLFEEEFFDFVICVTVAHHFHDTRVSLNNMKDVGKEGCVFVFSLLKGSGNYDLCLRLINEMFLVFKECDVHRDKLLFCRKK